MSQPQRRRKPAGKAVHRNPADQQLYDDLHRALPFSGRQFFKWCIIALDVAFCLYLTDQSWYYIIVQQQRGRVYFVAYTYGQIALTQLWFAIAYITGLWISRGHRRKP